MTGRLVAQALKRTTGALHDFQQLLLERRDEIHKRLESETKLEEIYRLQGKIAGLDELSNVLEQSLNQQEPTNQS